MKPWPRWLFWTCLVLALLTAYELMDAKSSKVLLVLSAVFWLLSRLLGLVT